MDSLSPFVESLAKINSTSSSQDPASAVHGVKISKIPCIKNIKSCKINNRKKILGNASCKRAWAADKQLQWGNKALNDIASSCDDLPEIEDSQVKSALKDSSCEDPQEIVDSQVKSSVSHFEYDFSGGFPKRISAVTPEELDSLADGLSGICSSQDKQSCYIRKRGYRRYGKEYDLLLKKERLNCLRELRRKKDENK